MLSADRIGDGVQGVAHDTPHLPNSEFSEGRDDR